MKLTPLNEGLLLLRNGLTQAVDRLGERLRQRQLEADVDPYVPSPAEVKLGLASRQWRLFKYLVTDIALWSDQRSAFLMRAIVDTRIVSAWLLAKNDLDLYERFVAFGRGRLKLYKLHFEDAAAADALEADLTEYLDALEEAVNRDILEEFQEIDLGGNFAGVNTRQMAAEAGLKRLYDLLYQGLSSETHPQWNALLANDLVYSTDPLHQGHRFGRFDTGAEETRPEVVWHAFLLVAETLESLFASLAVDVTRELEECRDALVQAWQGGVAVARGD